MGYNDQQNGYYGGNRPNQNDTQANYDYIAGQNRRNAEAEAARIKQNTPTYTPPPVASYTSSVSSPSYTTPSSSSSFSVGSTSSSSYVSSGGGGRSMAGSPLNNVYPDFQAASRSRADIYRRGRTPWAALFFGLILGVAVGGLPQLLLTQHLAVLEGACPSLTIFVMGLLPGITLLLRRSYVRSFQFLALGTIAAQLLLTVRGQFFLVTYLDQLRFAVDHVQKMMR